jgi:hypothetical protein
LLGDHAFGAFDLLDVDDFEGGFDFHGDGSWVDGNAVEAYAYWRAEDSTYT